MRIGPLGDLVNLDAAAPRRGAQPTIQFFSGIREAGFTAFGVEASRLPPRALAVAFATDAAAHQVETHAVGAGHHPLDSPYFHEGRLLLHASRHVLAQQHRLCDAAGMASYTVTGPRRNLAGPETVVQDCAAILDVAKALGSGCRLRLGNGPSPKHAFPSILEVRDATRGVPGLGLTYHLGLEHYCDRRLRGVEEYRATLRELPGDTLFVYGNCRIDEHGLGWNDYHAGRPATPEPAFFLKALQVEWSDATVLVQGIKPLLDAAEFLTLVRSVPSNSG